MTDVDQFSLDGGGTSTFVEEDSKTTQQGGSDDQKYWQVEVEHPGPGTYVAGARTDPQNYNSYLRLGTAAASPANNEGLDLQSYVASFYDDDRWTNANGAATNNLSAANRTAESGILYSKGGWRSHTEGNRVDTTRGDKVEVVRGNYQMVVLGRQDSAGNSSRYEASGGHFSRDDQNMTPGAIYEISYYTDSTFGSTWTTIEETVNGHHVSRYHGDVLEEYYGKEIKTYVGDDSGGTIPTGNRSSSGGAGNADKRLKWLSPDGTQNKINPKIEEHVWAKSLKMREHYGSTTGDWKVVYKLTQDDDGTVEEWKGKYKEDWNADNNSYTSDVYNVTVYEESIKAQGAIVATRLAGGTITDTDSSSTIHSFSLALVEQTAITTGIINNDTTLAGLNLDITVAGLNIGLVAAGLNLDTNLSKMAINFTKAALYADITKAGVISEMTVASVRHKSFTGAVAVNNVNSTRITKALLNLFF